MITIEAELFGYDNGVRPSWYFRWSCQECAGCGSWLLSQGQAEQMADAHDKQHDNGEIRS